MHDIVLTITTEMQAFTGGCLVAVVMLVVALIGAEKAGVSDGG